MARNMHFLYPSLLRFGTTNLEKRVFQGWAGLGLFPVVREVLALVLVLVLAVAKLPPIPDALDDGREP